MINFNQVLTHVVSFKYVKCQISEESLTESDSSQCEVTLSCKMVCASNGSKSHTPFGFITLSLIHRNAYSCWAKEELRVRLKAMKKNKR